MRGLCLAVAVIAALAAGWAVGDARAKHARNASHQAAMAQMTDKIAAIEATWAARERALMEEKEALVKRMGEQEAAMKQSAQWHQKELLAAKSEAAEQIRAAEAKQSQAEWDAMGAKDRLEQAQSEIEYKARLAKQAEAERDRIAAQQSAAPAQPPTYRAPRYAREEEEQTQIVGNPVTVNVNGNSYTATQLDDYHVNVTDGAGNTTTATVLPHSLTGTSAGDRATDSYRKLQERWSEVDAAAANR